MKTIVVNYLGRNGGGPVYAYEMTKGLIQNGYKVIAFLSNGIENLDSWKKLPIEHLEILETFTSIPTFIKNTILFRLFKYPRLKKKFKNIKVDATYIPMDHAWAKYINAIFPDAQTIFTIHDPIPHSTNQKLFRKITSLYKGINPARVDDVIILSNVFKKYVADTYKLSEDRVHVIPHGIFDFYKSIERGKVVKYEKNKKNFLFFGRICAYKGLDVLAEAFKIIQKESKEFTLSIVGNGDFEPYRKLYEGVQGVTVVNRWIKDEEVGSLFRTEEDVFLVVPYVDATQSGVIPIAMSYGVPVIASATGGLIEQVENEKTGFLVEPNNAKALAECMIKIAKNDNTEIIRNAEEFIDSLSWEALSKRLGEIVV